MKCRDFHEIIDSYLSDELLTETNHDVLRHMEACADCRSVIEARREVRSRLRNAVTNSPQYQISDNFAHNLRTQLKYEALHQNEAKTKSWLGFGSWIAVAAGLVLVFTFGFILLNNSGVDPETAYQAHQTEKLPQNHIVNVAFGDHQYCAIKYDVDNPVKLAITPGKYADLKEIAMPKLKDILADYEVKKSHTCEYENTAFTHLVIAKDDKTVSLMVTPINKADKIDEKISTFSSSKYQMARFDVNETAVFVVSDLNERTNTQVANSLYSPLSRHLTKDNKLQTSLLFFY